MGLTLPDTRTLVSAAAAFTLVLALFGAATIFAARREARRRRRIEERLDPRSKAPLGTRTLRLWHEGEQATLTVADRHKPGSLSERLEWLRKDAGLRTSVSTVLALMALGALALLGSVYLATGNALSAIGAALLPVLACWILLGNRIAKRSALFERQLVDGLELSARALRAGHPILGSFQLIAAEIPDPVGGIFADICQQHQMGVGLEQALARTATLSRNPDMRLFSASLAIQTRTGGNLADVVEGIAAVIRQRMRLNRRFRVLTAQTQLSKRVLLALPLVVFMAIQLISPRYLLPLLQTRPGNMLLAVAVCGMLLGWYVMNRMAQLKF